MPPFPRPIHLAALSLLFTPFMPAVGPLAAQEPLHLQVGAREIRATLGSSHATYTIAPPAPAPPTVLDESISWTERDGRRVLVKATTETSVDGISGDTLVMSAESLAPLSLVTFGGGRARAFRFEGRHIVGDIVEASGARQHVDTTLAEPAFAGPSFFTVLRSLPISATLDVTVPFFRPYDRAVVQVRYRALGTDTFPLGSETVPAWRIVGEIGGALAIYWLRQDTHELLRVVSFAPNAYGPIVMGH